MSCHPLFKRSAKSKGRVYGEVMVEGAGMVSVEGEVMVEGAGMVSVEGEVRVEGAGMVRGARVW